MSQPTLWRMIKLGIMNRPRPKHRGRASDDRHDTHGNRQLYAGTWVCLLRRRSGACFFGIPIERIDAYRGGVRCSAQFTPIGAISIGYSDELPRNQSGRRKPQVETLYQGRWNQSGR